MDRVTKDGLLTAVRADRARFEATLATVPRDRLADPILPGGWSVKDVLAHVAWGDREAIGVIEARALVGSPLWELDEDARNEAVVRESRALDLDDVIERYQASFARYVEALGRLSDEELNEPRWIRGLAERIPGWRPWRVVYDPDHYEEHRRTIEVSMQRLLARCGIRLAANSSGTNHRRLRRRALQMCSRLVRPSRSTEPIHCLVSHLSRS